MVHCETQVEKDEEASTTNPGLVRSHRKMERKEYDSYVETHGSGPDWNDKRP